MKNEVFINIDGINVYVTLKVKSKLVGKIILSIILSILYLLYFIILANIEGEKLGQFLVPLFIGTLILVFGPTKYLLWNLFGEEHFIINTKTISYYHSFGLFETRLKTTKFNRLGTWFEISSKYDNIEHGTLQFVNYNDDDNLPETLFNTSVTIPIKKLTEIHEAIQIIFYSEFIHRNQFVPFSLN